MTSPPAPARFGMICSRSTGRRRPADMLRIQLDDRALFLTRWRDFVTELLDTEALANQPQRAEFKQRVADWNARASVDSVGYRLVRAFHERTEKSVWVMMLSSLALTPAEPASVPRKV